MIRNLFKSLSGVFLLSVMFASLYLSAAIYDVSKKTTIDSFFFQPNEFYADRLGTPETPLGLGKDVMRNMLIERFITEYFYVIPDIDNVKQRSDRKTSLMFKMSSSTVFSDWKKHIVPTLQKMAEEKKLRTASLTGITKAPNQANYWIVDYDLKTWDKPNDFSVQPVVTHGQLYLKVAFTQGLRTKLELKKGETIESILESGVDPAAVFRIGIMAVNSYDEIEQGKR
jgi:hypothetical protein